MKLFCYQFRSYDYNHFSEENTKENLEQQVHIWCLNEHSEPVLVRFNYYSDTYMILPTYIGKRKMNWFAKTNSGVCFAEKLINRFLSEVEIPFKYKCILAKLCYYYKGENDKDPNKGIRYPAIKLRFSNTLMMKKFISEHRNYEIDGTKMNFVFYEDDLDIILKFICDSEIPYVGWIELEGKQVPIEDRISIHDEYIGDLSTLKAYEGQDLNSNSIKPSIVSFDIESYSHNPRAFPDSYDIRDPCFMICFVWKRLGFDETLNIGLVYGLCPPSSNCDHIITVNSEDEFYKKFGEIMRILDPEIITGYNICGYDFPVIYRRLVTYTMNGVMNISRLKELPTKQFFVDKSWSSSASSLNAVKKFETPGVICFDLYHYVSRELREPTNKLDYISKKYCNVGKDPITPKFMFETFKREKDFLHDVTGKSIKLTLKECLEAFDLSLLSDEQLEEYEDIISNMKKILHYCFVDCIRPLQLFDKFGMWIILCEMAATCLVQMEDVYSMGTGRRSTALIVKRGKEEGYVMDYTEQVYRKIAGGKVFDAKVGLHEDVMLLDFRSLYPTIMIGYNLCLTTMVMPGLKIDESRVQIYEEDEFKSMFIKAEEKKGILPGILSDLLDYRQQVRNEMKEETDPSILKIKNARQLAVKTCANAIYGYLPSQYSKFPCVAAGAFTTQLGRMNITKCSDAMTKKYGGQIVFGDTDSFAFKCNVSDPHELIKLSNNMLDDMNGTPEKQGMFPSSMEMELEVIGWYFHTGKKKNYAYCEMDMNPKSENFGKLKTKDGKFDIQMKGLPPVRRETTKWICDIYCELLQMIFSKRSFEDCLEVAFDSVDKLVSGDFNPKDLIKKNRMSGEYKSLTCPMKVFADRMEERGKPIQRGEMVEYLITKNGGTKNGEKMELYDTVIAEGLIIDNEYYILDTKKLFSIISYAYDSTEDIKWKYKTGNYQISKIAKYICRRFKDKEPPSLQEIKTEIFDFIKFIKSEKAEEPQIL